MEVNPKQIEPLLIEIFDMNKQNWPLWIYNQRLDLQFYLINQIYVTGFDR